MSGREERRKKRVQCSWHTSMKIYIWNQQVDTKITLIKVGKEKRANKIIKFHKSLIQWISLCKYYSISHSLKSKLMERTDNKTTILFSCKEQNSLCWYLGWPHCQILLGPTSPPHLWWASILYTLVSSTSPLAFLSSGSFSSLLCRRLIWPGTFPFI